MGFGGGRGKKGGEGARRQSWRVGVAIMPRVGAARMPRVGVAKMPRGASTCQWGCNEGQPERAEGEGSENMQGYLAHKKPPPLYDHRRGLGLGLLKGPRGWHFLMSEVPLQCMWRAGVLCFD